MEMADYWIEEKQLIHKLFKVLVPRFNDYQTSYTMLYRAPKAYPEIVYPRSVLELRGLHYYSDNLCSYRNDCNNNNLTLSLSGNPFPAILPQRSDQRNFIHNVLLDEAKKAYRAEKYEEITKSLEEEREE